MYFRVMDFITSVINTRSEEKFMDQFEEFRVKIKRGICDVVGYQTESHRRNDATEAYRDVRLLGNGSDDLGDVATDTLIRLVRNSAFRDADHEDRLGMARKAGRNAARDLFKKKIREVATDVPLEQYEAQTQENADLPLSRVIDLTESLLLYVTKSEDRDFFISYFRGETSRTTAERQRFSRIRKLIEKGVADEPAVLEALDAEPLTGNDFTATPEDIADAEADEAEIARLHDLWDAAVGRHVTN